MFNYRWVRTPDFSSLTKNVQYDDYWQYRGWSIQDDLKNREKKALNIIKPGEKAIDIGCGNSRLPVELKAKGVDVIAADVSPEVLKGYGKFDVSGVVLNLEDIDESKLSTVDYIILFEVLEHLRFPEESIATLKKYIKSFLITVPNSAAYYYRFSLLFRGRFFTQWVYHPSEHLRYWSHIDFLDWLDAMGLRVISSDATDGMNVKGLMPWLPNVWKNFFADRVVYHCEVKK